jgi:3-hydroxyacyl-CoA dehydrogenase
MKGKISPEVAAQKKSLITVTADYEDIKDADLVIEAINEDIEKKKEVFKELDRIMDPRVILTSNTSALSITEIARVTNRPDKTIITHFFNPATTMKLVEIVKGKQTSDETQEIVEDFCQRSLEKITIRVKEAPGFLVNRLLVPYLNEAALALEQGKFTCKALDQQVRDIGKWPMGPFYLLDVLGIDVGAAVVDILYKGFGERMKPSEILTKLVELKRFGEKKSGAGFYIYNKEKGFKEFEEILEEMYPGRKEISVEEVFNRMMTLLLNEAVLSLEDKIATADDIETGCLFGIAFPGDGPLHYIDEIGADKVLADLERYKAEYGMRYEPSKLLKEYAQEGKKFFAAW